MRLPSAAMCGLQQQLSIRPCPPRSGHSTAGLGVMDLESNGFLRKPVGHIGRCRRLPGFSGATCGVLYLQKTCSKQDCSLLGSSRLLAGTGFSSFPSLLDIRIGCCASSMLSTQYCTGHELRQHSCCMPRKPHDCRSASWSNPPSLLDMGIGCCASSMLSLQRCT